MVKEFLQALKATPTGDVFNPWWDIDEYNDASGEAPEIRRRQLGAYLTERIHKARYLLVAEALGYQGGHFSGIPMTSERILLGHFENIPPSQVIRITPQRTSKAAIKADGFSEPTATIVWGQIMAHCVNSRDVILWNAFPWHPHKHEEGLLSNRTPTEEELSEGGEVIKYLIQLLKVRSIIAIGKEAQRQLHQLGINAVPVRHPANGGANEFRKDFGKSL